jgi:hypothetical protein
MVSVRMRGIDLVLEGEAHRVTDPSTLERLAAVYRSGGWPAEVEGDAFTAPFSAPSARLGRRPRHGRHRAGGRAPAQRQVRRPGQEATCDHLVSAPD